MELAPSVAVTLYEAKAELGGVVQTERRDGFLIEHAADNFLSNLPAAIDLCRRIGFENELLPTDPARRRAFVVKGRRLIPVPEGFLLMAPTRLWPLATSPLLSFRGKLRLACEPFVRRRRDAGDESLGAFARRRLGREAFDRLVQPLVAGIFSADPERLSMRAALPRFVQMEARHGSLVKAARREAAERQTAASGARYGLFVAPRMGMSQLVDALASRLAGATIALNTQVESLSRTPDGRWQVAVAADRAPQTFDAAIVALPAPSASRLLESVDRDLATDLASIPYAGTSIVCAAFDRVQIAHPLDGFGFVVPAVERRRLLAGSFASVKFPGRAPEGKVLMRFFIGGATQPTLVDLDDEALRRIALDEAGELLGIQGPPLFATIRRWPAAMPQYHLGHVDLVERIESRVAAQPGLALAGNAYRGVGIPQCIESGERAAADILGDRNSTQP